MKVLRLGKQKSTRVALIGYAHTHTHTHYMRTSKRTYLVIAIDHVGGRCNVIKVVSPPGNFVEVTKRKNKKKKLQYICKYQCIRGLTTRTYNVMLGWVKQIKK